MVSLALFLSLASFELLICFLLINSVIVFNTVRYMAIAPSMSWRDSRYVRHLPCLLKHLRDAGFSSPWPACPSAFSAWRMRRRLCRCLKGAMPGAETLIQQHLGLWAFIQLHQDELRHLLRRRQMARARKVLAESLDSEARGRVLGLLQDCRAAQAHAVQASPPPAATSDTVEWIVRLHALDMLFAEHGYQLSTELTLLDHWESADDRTILNELPVHVK